LILPISDNRTHTLNTVSFSKTYEKNRNFVSLFYRNGNVRIGILGYKRLKKQERCKICFGIGGITIVSISSKRIYTKTNGSICFLEFGQNGILFIGKI